MIAVDSFENTNVPLKWARDMNKQFLMENIHMANKQMETVLDDISYQERRLQLQ